MSGLDTFRLYAVPYAATLLIAAVCAWLGLLCVYRRIVFTGAALAQLAAMGAAAALFLVPRVPAGWAEGVERWGPAVGSLSASFLGALGLRSRRLDPRVTPDARVGMVYGGAAALAVLFVWRSASGPAELSNLLAGEVLLARPGELLGLAAGLLAAGALLFCLRAELLLVSFDPEFAAAAGLPVQQLELAFLGALALAVALSLQVAGLLLTFAFLVLSPLVGLLLGRGTREVTLLGPLAGLGASFLGFAAAIRWDLPVAPTIAAALLGLVGVAFLAGRGRGAPRLARALVSGLAATSLLVMAVGLVSGAPARPEPSPATASPAPTTSEPPPGPSRPPAGALERDEEGLHHDLADLGASPDVSERVAAAARLGRRGDARALEGLLAAQVDLEPEVRRAVGAALRSLAGVEGVHDRLHRELASGGAEARALAALALASAGERAGLEGLVACLADAEAPFPLRAEAVERLRALRGPQEPELPAYEPLTGPQENREALAAWRAWWAAIGPCLRWDEARGVFVREHAPGAADPHGPGRR